MRTTFRLWLRTVEDKRKSCPHCKTKLWHGGSVWSGGRYIAGKWRNVIDRFCQSCWSEQRDRLLVYHDVSELVSRGDRVPYWLVLPGVVAAETLENLRVISSFLPRPLTYRHVPHKEDNLICTSSVTFDRDEWEFHPLRDRLMEIGVEPQVSLLTLTGKAVVCFDLDNYPVEV